LTRLNANDSINFKYLIGGGPIMFLLKSFLIAFTILTSTVVFAAPATETSSTQTQSTVDWDNVEFDAPTTRTKAFTSFFLGASKIENSDSGIAVGIQRTFSRFNRLSIGADYTNYRSDDGYPTQETADAYMSGSMIKYSRANLTFRGDVLLGAIYNNYDGEEMFYGAAASINYNKEIGLRIDQKVANRMGTQSTVSLVGYY
jgi:hypothetical protein